MHTYIHLYIYVCVHTQLNTGSSWLGVKRSERLRGFFHLGSVKSGMRQWPLKGPFDPKTSDLTPSQLLFTIFSPSCNHPADSKRPPAILVVPQLTSTLQVNRFGHRTSLVDKQVGTLPDSLTKDGPCKSCPQSLPVHFRNNVPSTSSAFTSVLWD